MKQVEIGTLPVPETIEQLQFVFLHLCRRLGLEIKGEGSSYSNGVEHNCEIRLAGDEDGPLEAFTLIRESQDDNYLIARYEGEPIDPSGETSPTPTLTNEGAEALRRELEEEEFFAERMKGDDRVIQDAMTYIRAQRERQGLDPREADDDDIGSWIIPPGPDPDDPGPYPYG